MIDARPETPSPSYKDRRNGLVLFGVLLIVVGCLCALMVPLMLLASVVAAQAPGGAAMSWRQTLPSALTYGAMSVALVWLGIGSITARRWARTLLVVVSWGWLVTGVLVTVMMAFFLPRMLAITPSGNAEISPAVRWVVSIFMLGFLGVFFILLPGVLVLFYGRKDVKQTCEARDPLMRWTDACPVPVLGASLFVGFGGAMMLPTLLSYNGVAPCFGILVDGVWGVLVFLTTAAVLGYCSWALYHRSLAGWWLTVAAYAVLMSSTVITLARIDLVEMYRAMGFSEAQLEQFQRMDVFDNKALVGMVIAMVAPVFGYLIFVRRYFRSAA